MRSSAPHPGAPPLPRRRCCCPQAFLDYYYNLFSTNRAGLATLYQEPSMLTFEGQKFQGVQAIVNKLAALPFAQCRVQRLSSDFQPSISGGILVFVTGNIQVGWRWEGGTCQRAAQHMSCRAALRQDAAALVPLTVPAAAAFRCSACRRRGRTACSSSASAST